MRNSRHIAVVASASVLVSRVVAVQRKAIKHSMKFIGRKKEIKKLNDWYQTCLTQIEANSQMEADQYIDSHHEHLVSVARSRGYHGVKIDGFIERARSDVRDFIRLYKKSQVTRKYADLLNGVDSRLGRQADDELRAFILRADKVAQKLRDKSCRIESLMTPVHIDPP